MQRHCRVLVVVRDNNIVALVFVALPPGMRSSRVSPSPYGADAVAAGGNRHLTYRL